MTEVLASFTILILILIFWMCLRAQKKYYEKVIDEIITDLEKAVRATNKLL